jgi:hypothetical protein
VREQPALIVEAAWIGQTVRGLQAYQELPALARAHGRCVAIPVQTHRQKQRLPAGIAPADLLYKQTQAQSAGFGLLRHTGDQTLHLDVRAFEIFG